MRLKSYQQRIISELTRYLDLLMRERCALADVLDRSGGYPALLADLDYIENAWKGFSISRYHPVKNNLGISIPDVYFKVPTGGGKTLLALHALQKIQSLFLGQEHGLVLWIVPTEQIYSQTLRMLQDRSNPYRQILDNFFSGRIMIRERTQPFTKEDCKDKLVIMPLMLPATNRNKKETLRLYNSCGLFADFFPEEDDHASNDDLVRKIPNLDCLPDDRHPSSLQFSLANVFRMARPVVIVDEGHRTFTKLARNTLLDFNPVFMLELSATPPDEVNIVSAASGTELHDEEMIKLDINLVDQANPEWKSVCDRTVAKRQELEAIANDHHQNTGVYIRPIALIQVERTGAMQRDNTHIHSEDVKQYLMDDNAVLPHEIAIKTSAVNELAGVDLLSPECPIKYIITKQALQEGWDCSFAYVLAILSNLSGEIAVTQLVGRILRQPYAKKTGIRQLDECHVYSNHGKSDHVVKHIRRELAEEGLMELDTHINIASTDPTEKINTGIKVAKPRARFKEFSGTIYMPQFMVNDAGTVRPLLYENDLERKIVWDDLFKLVNLYKFHSNISQTLSYRKIGLKPAYLIDQHKQFPELQSYGDQPVDPLVLTKRLQDLIPNAWVAHQFACDYLDRLLTRENEIGTESGASPQQRIFSNMLYIVEYVRNEVANAKNAMTYHIFNTMLEQGELRLMLLTGEGSWKIPVEVTVRESRVMVGADNQPMRNSLFDDSPDEEFDSELERSVALYLDNQKKLLWWYRNQVKTGYSIQGWRKWKVYPDFIISKNRMQEIQHEDQGKVLVAEIKGDHLKDLADTQYKRSLLELCNHVCSSATHQRQEKWSTLAKSFSNSDFHFQLVDQEGWRQTLDSFFEKKVT